MFGLQDSGSLLRSSTTLQLPSLAMLLCHCWVALADTLSVLLFCIVPGWVGQSESSL